VRAQARLALQNSAALPVLPPLPAAPTPQQLVAERLQAKPQVMNSNYSIAEGAGSQDIVPTLVFDDGRFTYFGFPGNREVPAVFHVLGDGSETLLNARMEDDLLVVDRVSRRLMLRAGSAVVGVWNEAFDVNGVPPGGGTTVPGVQRMLRADAGPDRGPQGQREDSHD
jgi:type IV secretion system protein VirB9